MMQRASRSSNRVKSSSWAISTADIILIVSGIIVIFINPAVEIFRTGCIFRWLTGFYCAGCGMSRGFYAIFRGNINAAMQQNILLVTLIPAALLFLFSRYYTRLKYPLYQKKCDSIVISVFIMIVIFFTVCRNIPHPFFKFLIPH